MFESKTFEAIMNEMLDTVPSSVDKREGSIIWDSLAPCAMELANTYIYMDIILKEAYADTASYYYLAKRANELDVRPKAATYAQLKAVFQPKSVEIPIGSIFNLDALNYSVLEKLTDGEYSVLCETAGAVGNRQFGKIIPSEYIKGLESAEITELIIPGEDDEDVEVFRSRYFSTLNSEAFGGNIDDYKQKVNEIEGVGGVKVYPVWNGGGTVKIVFVDSDYKIPSQAFVDGVQTIIDPIPNQGEGLGIAPIGHYVTVLGATPRTINISANITYREGWSFDNTEPFFIEAIDNYFLELAKEWENADGVIVRISQIETRFLNITGIIDIEGTTLNGAGKNLLLSKDEVPVRGVING